MGAHGGGLREGATIARCCENNTHPFHRHETRGKPCCFVAINRQIRHARPEIRVRQFSTPFPPRLSLSSQTNVIGITRVASTRKIGVDQVVSSDNGAAYIKHRLHSRP